MVRTGLLPTVATIADSESTMMKPSRSLVDERGPWPFITQRVFGDSDGSTHIWSSRHHRKGLLVGVAVGAEGFASTLCRCLWSPRKLNWWIGTIFATGSMLFTLASLLVLSPTVARAFALDAREINIIYFVGSIAFTTAAYLQLFQAANVIPPNVHLSSSTARRKLFGWRPGDIGWMSSALQFIGTILFNFNTFDALVPGLSWIEQDFVIWLPDFAGSILFLSSGYLAFIETCHQLWAWKPDNISWWVVLINLAGCVGFMVSAVLSIVLPGSPHPEIASIATAFTLQGAICFLTGSLLMLPEMAVHSES
ncbi:hypothetical protein Poly21_11210 [Allorhodopirellula heiligendammensis]|uniref:YrhK domain-containing protein n=2 Tax=Allorhodopirellula heiligendammensis TaxID=2714739 RepID=A0A5C6C326_9BACT|nr:hypothetical protein Poly21_11210 [Allorhodopirellula heiligendammensis]